MSCQRLFFPLFYLLLEEKKNPYGAPGGSEVPERPQSLARLVA